jgi:hypothetical protein
MPHKRCPFCGTGRQTIVPCEVQAEQSNGKYKPEIWYAVLCNCTVGGRAGKTPQQAWKNWNTRAKKGNLPQQRREFEAHQTAIRSSEAERPRRVS